MAQPISLRFEEGNLRPVDAAPVSRTVLAADSFVITDGRAVGWKKHIDRFEHAVVQAAGSLPEGWETFLDQSLSTLHRTGQWFPRFDYSNVDGNPTLLLLIRSCPTRFDSVVVATASTDTRKVPWRKGPDLHRMGLLREEVALRGAGEALILGPESVVIEGAYSAVLVWKNDHTVSVTPPKYPRIPSVTESVVSQILSASGVEVINYPHKVGEMENKEVWVVSALHGIRAVSSFIDGPSLLVDRHRRHHFQAVWESRATPLVAGNRT